jgi:hypothetical protein
MTEFSREYFLEQAVHFRELMGTKSFWSDLKKAGKGMYGMLYCYIKTKDLLPEDETLMRSLSIEYDRRLALVILMKE